MTQKKKNQAIINSIMNTPMDRKQFLARVGIGALAMSSLGAGLKLFSNKAQNKNIAASDEPGYGGGAYGA